MDGIGFLGNIDHQSKHAPLRCEDVYVVFAGIDPHTSLPVIHAFLNPLVKWIWLGGVWVVMGTLLALMPNRRAALAVAPVPQTAASPIAQALNPSVTLREGHD